MDEIERTDQIGEHGTTYRGIEHKAPLETLEDSKTEAWWEFENKAFMVLEAQGYITIDEVGQITVDTDKFRNFGFKRFRHDMFTSDPRQPLLQDISTMFGSNSVQVIANLFWNRQVLVKGTEHRGLIKGLAIPETRAIGLSEEYLRNNISALQLWDLGRNRLPKQYPTTKDGWDSNLSTHDFVVGYLVLNQRYGSGMREGEDQTLMVNYPSRRRAIGGDFFKEWGYSGKPTDGKFQISGTPYEFISRYCQELLSRGILYPEDFQRQSGISFGIGSRRVGNQGVVWTENMAFSLGREYAGMQVYRMSPGLAAVVSQETGLIEAVFKLGEFNDVNINVVDHWKGSSYKRVKKEGVILYKGEDLIALAQEESEVAYWRDNLEKFLSLSTILARRADLDISSLALKQQVDLVEIFSSFEHYQEALLNFVIAYRSEGLKTLILGWDIFGDINGFLEIGQQMDPFRAKDIFEEAALVDEQIYSVLGDGLADDTWAIESRQKVCSLILAALPLIRDEDVGYDTIDIVSGLRDLRVNELDVSDSGYLELLKNYSGSEGAQKNLYLNRLVKYWQAQIYKEKKYTSLFKQGRQEVLDFYTQVESLEAHASETTGTTYHLKLAKDFVRQLTRKFPQERVNILDQGSGSGARITLPLSEEFPQVSFTGVDLRTAKVAERENLHFRIEDFTRLSDPDETYSSVYSVWSPWMDVHGVEGQIQSALEAYRVLVPGGRLMIEAADLEGEGKSWQAEARKYKGLHPQRPYGTIRTQIEGGVGEREFNIFPKEQLVAILEASGFEEVELQTYTTENNVPIGRDKLSNERKVANV